MRSGTRLAARPLRPHARVAPLGCSSLSLHPEMRAGVKIYIEPRALLTILGTTMDYKDDHISSEFVFTNPNAKGVCGCGESFSV